ncbi:MAG: hypothetical protein IJ299_04840 [Oscillospiraceae bacterium]|nr:hypothetical protein [Oscillospiraceae bacterium]
MGIVQSWVSSIATVTLIVSAITALCPKNSAGRAVMLSACIVMTATLLSPLGNIKISALSDGMEKYSRGAEKRYEELLKEQENMKDRLIEENVRAYILQRAESEGIECDIVIRCRDGAPYSAEIAAEKEKDLIAASELTEKELGVLRARQTLKKEAER